MKEYRGNGPSLAEWRKWDLHIHGPMLKKRSGSLAMRVRLQKPWLGPRNLQRKGVLKASTYAAWLDNSATAVAGLASIMPREFVDTSFPGKPTKFDLLNGWRVARSTSYSRTGYRRVRLFRTKFAEQVLHFEMSAPAPTNFTFFVNAELVGSSVVEKVWTSVAIDISSAREGEVFALELRRDGEPATFEEGCFEVRLPGARPSIKEIAISLVPQTLRRRMMPRLRAILFKLRRIKKALKRPFLLGE